METNKKLIKQLAPNKIKNEIESRYNLLTIARAQGCEPEVKVIFAKTEKLLYNCTNPVERKQIVVAAIAELYQLLNVQGGLSIDGIEFIQPNLNNPNNL